MSAPLQQFCDYGVDNGDEINGDDVDHDDNDHDIDDIRYDYKAAKQVLYCLFAQTP